MSSQTAFETEIASLLIEALDLEDISAEEIAQLQASKVQVETYLQQLVADISKLQQIPEDEPVTLHYIDSDVVNAFATLGNHVFVFTGLLEKLPNENALFMVLSHEVAHLKHKDPIRALGRGITLSFLLSVIGGVTDGNAIGQHFGQAGLLTALSFNRDQERAADLTGLETLTNYYGHSKGATEFFEFILAELNAGSSYEIFNSHPLTEDRIQTLLANSQITNQPTKPLPEFVQAHLSLLKQIRQPKQESAE